MGERRTYLASSTRICVDLWERVGFFCEPVACEPLGKEPALSGSPVLPRLAASAPEPELLLLYEKAGLAKGGGGVSYDGLGERTALELGDRLSGLAGLIPEERTSGAGGRPPLKKGLETLPPYRHSLPPYRH